MHLLKHFKELTVRPKNAHKLKGLILQLAIQGKLTANWRNENPDVEPASELLKRIQKEKEQLIKEKKIKKENPLPPITKEDIPYELPEGWIWCRLGQSGYTQTGSTPPKKHPKNYGDFIPFIGPADISNKWMKYPVDGLSEIGLSIGRLIPKNSLMMVCIGGSIGKCNVNKIDVSCNQQINTVTPISVPVSYVKNVCQSPYFQKKVLGKSSGSATPIINKGKWEVLPFPLPPLEEQKAIVKVVKTLFKEVEQLEQLTVERITLKENFVASALNQLATNNIKKEWAFLQEHFHSFFNETSNIKKLRETVLQLAVQGKLTADWRKANPEVEDASELLKDMEVEKKRLIKEKKIKAYHKMHAKAKELPSFEVPDSWERRRFWDVIWCFRGHNPPKSEFIDAPREGYVRFVQITDFKTDTRAVYVPDSHKLKRVEKGEILMAAYRHIGKLSRKMEGAFNVALCKVNCIEPFNIDFLEMLIGTQIVKGELLAESQRGHIPSMHSDHLLSLWIPVPPLEEQQAIVQKVKSLMGLCDALEQQVQQSQGQSEQLMKSVLREIFEGKKMEEVPV